MSAFLGYRALPAGMQNAPMDFHQGVLDAGWYNPTSPPAAPSVGWVRACIVFQHVTRPLFGVNTLYHYNVLLASHSNDWNIWGLVYRLETFQLPVSIVRAKIY